MAAPTINIVSPLDGAVNVAPDVPLVFKVTSNDAAFVTDYETLVATVNAQQVFANNQPLGGWTGRYQTLADGSRVYTLLPPEGFAYGAKVSAAFSIDYRVATDHLEFAEAPVVVDGVAKAGAGFLTFADSVTVQDALVDGTMEKAFADTVTTSDAATVETGGGGGGWVEVPMTAAFPLNRSTRFVFGVGPHEIYATNRTIIGKWNGVAWSVVRTDQGDAVKSLWGTPGSIWAACSGTPFQSTDGGTTWNPQALPEPDANVAWGWSLNASTMYLYGSTLANPSRVWVSNNGGASFAVLFDAPGDAVYNSMWGFSTDPLFFVGQEVDEYSGGGVSTLSTNTASETLDQIWGPVAGTQQLYWCSDAPDLPHRQVMHADSGIIVAENGPYPTNGGTNPTVQLQTLFGQDTAHIYAGGFGTGIYIGGRLYSLQMPGTPGTWVEETLPSTIGTDAVGNIASIWVDKISGQVCVIGNRDDGGGNSMPTSFFKNLVP